MNDHSLAWPGTPFSRRTAELNTRALWMRWDRMMVVDVYTDAADEVAAIRSSVAMGDMSPLAKHRISGPDAQALVDLIATRDISVIEPGQVCYTPWCDDRGKVIGDGLVFRLAEDVFRISADPFFDWIRSNGAGLDVVVKDESDALGILTLQGPLAADALGRASDEAWDDLPFSRVRTGRIAGCDVQIARQGFTGELGYEVWVDAENCVRVWSAVEAAGAELGITPAGALALDIARIEAGLLIVGYDYTGARSDRHGAAVVTSDDNQATPFELGLGRLVDFGKERFIGREALLHADSAPGARRLGGLELDWQQLVAGYGRTGQAPPGLDRVHWYPRSVEHDGVAAGHTTSIVWSPTLRRLIGFGHLDPAAADPGTEVTVRWDMDNGQEVGAVVVPTPFLELRRQVALA